MTKKTKKAKASKKISRSSWLHRAQKKIAQFDKVVAKWEAAVIGTPVHEAVSGLHSVVVTTGEALTSLGEDFAPRSGKKREWSSGDRVTVKADRAGLYLEGAGEGVVTEVHKSRDGRGAQVKLRVRFETVGHEGEATVAQFVVGSASDFQRV